MPINLSSFQPPSAATIAAAVAAPSTSTIATAVAAAVPTRANIQSDIQTYASGYANSYTLLTSGAPTNGTGTFTLSWSAGSYKKIIIGGLIQVATGPVTASMRLNGDTNINNYVGTLYNIQTTTSAFFNVAKWHDYIAAIYQICEPTGGQNCNFKIEIEGANTTTPKVIKSFGGSAGVARAPIGEGLYLASAAITSATIFLSSSTFSSSPTIYVLGVS